MLVTLITVLVVLSAYYIHKKLTYWDKRGITNKKPFFPYIIPLHLFNRHNPHMTFKRLYTKYQGQGPVLGFYAFLQPHLIALDVNFVKDIMITDNEYFYDRYFYSNEKDDPFSYNLFSMAGKKWRDLRTKLTPTFSASKLKHMFPLAARVADELNNAIANQIANNSPVIDFQELIYRFSTDVISTCAFGVESNALNNQKSLFRQTGADLQSAYHGFKIIAGEMMGTWAHRFHMVIVPKKAREFFMKLVKDTIKYRLENNVERPDLISILMKWRATDVESEQVNTEKLTLNEIGTSAFLYFFAGSETSAVTISYALYELAQNNELQEKLRKTILEVLPKYNGEVTYDALAEMVYMDQCINETLRKYPAAPVTTRKAVKDYQLPGTNSVISKGTAVFIPILAIHHDPVHYPNPKTFDPERFSPEACVNRHPGAYLPFGLGPRVCPGYKFAIMEIKLALAVLLSNYRFTPAATTPKKIFFSNKTLSLSSPHPINLAVEKI